MDTNTSDWIAALHRRAVDRVTHLVVRESLEAHTWLEVTIAAGCPTFRLCGTLPDRGPDRDCAAKCYERAMAEALRGMTGHGAMHIALEDAWGSGR